MSPERQMLRLGTNIHHIFGDGETFHAHGRGKMLRSSGTQGVVVTGFEPHDRVITADRQARWVDAQSDGTRERLTMVQAWLSG